MDTYLAIDIGASNGRHVIGFIDEASRLIIKEIYRFPNQGKMEAGRLIWDVEELSGHVLEGIKQAGELGYKPKTIGIDTWGVDFALLDASGKRLDDIVAYRDTRTQGMPELVESVVPYSEIYERTGTQKQVFNTIYQLAAIKEQTPDLLEQASHLLMMPDYLNYLLTGEIASEYTNATTTGLVNVRSRDWDRELIDRLGYPQHIFKPLQMPGTTVGLLKADIVAQTGFESTVIHVPAHDTASAFLAVPLYSRDTVILSSGTWSLLGIELEEPIVSEEALLSNFANEGCYNGDILSLIHI